MKRVCVILAIVAATPLFAIEPGSITGEVSLGVRFVAGREDALSGGWFPASVQAEAGGVATAELRFSGGPDASSLSVDILAESLGGVPTLAFREVLLALRPDPRFEAAIGFGMKERGEGSIRAIFDLIGSGKPYPGLGLSWNPRSDLEFFSAIDVSGLDGPVNSGWAGRAGFETGFSWSPGALHVLAAAGRLGSGLVFGGTSLSLDIAGGIWIAEFGAQARSPALYPEGAAFTARTDDVFPSVRLSALYALSAGDGSILAEASASLDAAGYTPSELLLVLPYAADFSANGTLAPTGRVGLGASVAWQAGSGASITLAARLNPLDLSAMAALETSVPVGDADIVLSMQVAGGDDPQDEFRLALPPFWAKAVCMVYL